MAKDVAMAGDGPLKSGNRVSARGLPEWPEPTKSYNASNPFSLSFANRSLGLFADDSNQSRTLPIVTVCVTPGLLASTSINATGPGAQSCSRNSFTARATASYSVSACTFTEWRRPSGSEKETVQARTGTSESYHIRRVFALGAHPDSQCESGCALG